MVEIHLYGELGRYTGQTRPDRSSVVYLPIEDTLTIGKALQQMGIKPEEVGQVFLNGRLLSTRSKMAPWLGYQTAEERLPTSGTYLETLLRAGDRLGLFPPNMAILVI
mgnify:CR=1 FL=1